MDFDFPDSLHFVFLFFSLMPPTHTLRVSYSSYDSEHQVMEVSFNLLFLNNVSKIKHLQRINPCKNQTPREAHCRGHISA